LHPFVDLVQLIHEASSFIFVITGTFDLSLQALTLDDVGRVSIIDGAASQLLDLVINSIVFGLGLFEVFTLKLTLDALLLHSVVVLISSLMLHFLHEKNVRIDLFGEAASVTTLVPIDRTKIRFKLFPVFVVLGSIGYGFSLDLAELFGLLELSLVLSSGTSSLKISLELEVLLIKVFLELLFDIFLCILVVIEHLLEILVSARVLQLVLELGEFIAFLDLELCSESFFLKVALSLVLRQVLL